VKSDLLVRIKDAEAEAASRQSQAEGEAQAIVADARRQAEAILAEARTQADFAHQSRLEAARKAADEDAKKVVAAGNGQAAALRKRFESVAADAAPRVVKLFEERLG
jgi:vacuolar-type H+-ATPase subunit H